MTTLKTKLIQKSKKKVISITPRAAKRIQWDTYRRYGLYNN